MRISGLPKSTYYFEISKKDPDEKNKDLIGLIVKIFAESKGTYGVRRVAAEIRNMGILISRKKVHRLMKKLGLKAKRPREKYRSYEGEVGKVADNVVNRDFKADAPNRKWTTDVTQLNCPFGKAYLSPVIDMFDGYVVGWDLSLSPNMEQVNRMLDMAFGGNGSLEGLIMHSDQGWQYQNPYYRRRLEERGIVQSMSRKGNCLDNSIMESFFGILKVEMFYGHEGEFRTFGQLKRAIEEYIDYYNNKRIRERTGWLPPAEYRESAMRAAL